MKKYRVLGYVGACVLSALLSSPLLADRGEHDRDDDKDNGRNARSVKAELASYQEVPAISSPCDGVFRARISDDNNQVQYELSYANLEGNVAQAHIHFAQKGVNGGISLFLCTNLGNGPQGTQPCPGPTSGAVSGVWTANDVLTTNIPGSNPPATQGIAAGELSELIAALRAGKTYINVHSSKFPGGECRGQIR